MNYTVQRDTNRKRIIKMARFHYIWMGRSPVGLNLEGAFKDGPNALAKQLQHLSNPQNRKSNSPNPLDQEIILWMPANLIQEIQQSQVLDPSITLKPVEDFYKEATHFSAREKENLQRAVDVLGEHNAYASQKDIFSAAILEEYGGYFLDTTTHIDSIEHLITEPPQDVWFPRISTYGTIEHDGLEVICLIFGLYIVPIQEREPFRAW